MTITHRFGKKLPIPSTFQIKHELRLMIAADDLAAATAVKERASVITELACKHSFSRDRAEMLVDRYGIGRAALEGAAQDLGERRRAV